MKELCYDKGRRVPTATVRNQQIKTEYMLCGRKLLKCRRHEDARGARTVG